MSLLIGRRMPAFRTSALNVLLVFGVASTSNAQQATSSPGDALQEITVTAQKRAEDNQQVPLPVSVISGEELYEEHIADLTQIAATVPGLTVEGLSPGQTHYFIRGLAAFGASFATQSPIGFYIDNVPVTMPNVYQTGQFDPSLLDIARVEVLEGPQGTLYGGGAVGGAIKFIMNQPDPNQFSGKIGYSIADVSDGAPNYTQNAIINAPLIPGVLTSRTSISYSKIGGYIDFTLPNANATAFDGQTFHNINSSSTLNLHETMVWQLSDNVKLTPSMYFQKVSAQSGNDVSSGCCTIVGYYYQQPLSDTVYLPSLNLDASLPGVDLTSNLSYYYRDWRQLQDFSLDFSPYTEPNGPLTPSYSPYVTTSTAVTSETRLQSKGSGPWKWVAGVFAQWQKNEQTQTVYQPGFTQQTGGTYQGFPIVNDILGYDRVGNVVRQGALFGEVSYNFSNGLEFTVGGREFDSSTDQYPHSYQYGWAEGGYALIPEAHSKTPGFVPKFDVSYKFDDQSKMVYALASKGYRNGGPNGVVPAALCAKDLGQLGLTSAPSSFGPDSAWNYEVGTKTEWLDHRVRLNVSVYDIEWKNIQNSTYLNDCGFNFISNIAGARSQGSEAEGAVAVGGGVELGGTLSFINAYYTNTVPQIGITDGSAFSNIPRRTASAYANYKTAVSFLPGWNFVGRVSWSYYGSVVIATGSPFDNLASYDFLNAHFGIDNGRWNVGVFGTNLLNKIGYVSGLNGYYNIPPLPPVTTDWGFQPRAIGINVDYKF